MWTIIKCSWRLYEGAIGLTFSDCLQLTRLPRVHRKRHKLHATRSNLFSMKVSNIKQQLWKRHRTTRQRHHRLQIKVKNAWTYCTLQIWISDMDLCRHDSNVAAKRKRGSQKRKNSNSVYLCSLAKMRTKNQIWNSGISWSNRSQNFSFPHLHFAPFHFTSQNAMRSTVITVNKPITTQTPTMHCIIQ